MTDSTQFVSPSYYTLKKATISSQFSPNLDELDITTLIPRLTISSSIESETMYGMARIVDSVGLLENTPLRAEEKIIFEIQDSQMLNSQETEQLDTFKFIGFIYKIDNATMKNVSDAIMYDIHFISYQSFLAGTNSIIRPYKDVKISDIVKQLFDEYYKPSSSTSTDEFKDITVEDTEGLIRCVIPKMRPEEAMSFLSKRSYSSQSPSCTFRFFENQKGYFFTTDEELFRKSESEGTSETIRFTFLEAIPNTLDFFDEQRNNLETLENTDRVNSLSDIYNGAYRNKVLELDILRKRTNLLDGSGQYDYFQNQSRYFNADQSQQISDKHTEEFIKFSHKQSGRDNDKTNDVQKTFIVARTYSNEEEANESSPLSAETYYTTIISNRQAYSKHLNTIVLEASGPGRFDVTAGDIVELDIRQFIVRDGESTEYQLPNKHLSGKYIVKSITHSMEHDEMKNSYVLVKKDWSFVYTSGNDERDLIGPR